MHQSEIRPIEVSRPRVTVAAIVEREGRFLVVEERDAAGGLVINQPAGHVEGGESLTDAVIRETFEETGWHFAPEFLVGIYLWRRPDTPLSYLRVAIAGRPVGHDPDAPLDKEIVRALWLTYDELKEHAARMRSPMVMRCLDDYLEGERSPLYLLKSLLT